MKEELNFCGWFFFDILKHKFGGYFDIAH